MLALRPVALCALFAVAASSALFLPTASAARDIPKAARYVVGGEDGWTVPPRPEDSDMYSNWASNITFHVRDSLEFVYKNDSVVKVDKKGYYHCLSATATPPKDGTTVFVLDEPGWHYFASADTEHCKRGLRLMVEVESGAHGPSPAHKTSAATAPEAASFAVLPLVATAAFFFAV